MAEAFAYSFHATADCISRILAINFHFGLQSSKGMFELIVPLLVMGLDALYRCKCSAFLSLSFGKSFPV
eukprot:scaffold664618_cov32-Prasinocladus_malaysianus.AAC.1